MFQPQSNSPQPIQAIRDQTTTMHAFFCVMHGQEIFDRLEPALVLMIGRGARQRGLICNQCKGQLPDLAVIQYHKVEEYPEDPSFGIAPDSTAHQPSAE